MVSVLGIVILVLGRYLVFAHLDPYGKVLELGGVSETTGAT